MEYEIELAGDQHAPALRETSAMSHNPSKRARLRGILLGTLWCVYALASLDSANGWPRDEQEQSESGLQFRQAVDLGRLEVVAIDDRRRPVVGLTAADFKLRIDGKESPIKTFAAIAVPPFENGTNRASWTRDVPPDVQTNDGRDEGRLIVIFFDRSIPPGPKLLTARRIAARVVGELRPGDLAAVLNLRGGPVQNFTADRTRLMRAIAGSVPGSAQGEDEAAMNARVFTPDVQRLFAAHDACVCNACVLDSIGDIATVLRDVPRRKVLIFIGSQLTMSAADIDPIGGPMSRIAIECSVPVTTARTKMLRALDSANVTVHSFDPSGLETAANAANVQGREVSQATATRMIAAFQGQIRVLPDRTGGRTIINTNAPESLVPAALAESTSYYVLGFAVPNDLRPSAQVDIRTDRPGVRLHFQKTFDAPAVLTRQDRTIATSDSDSALRMGLLGILPTRDVKVQVNALPVRAPDTGQTGVLVVAGLPGVDGSPQLSGVRRYDLVISAFDPRLQPRGAWHHVVDVTRQGRHVDVPSFLQLGPGNYEIRVGASDSDGKVGSVVTYVDVPDFGREAVSLSGLAVGTVLPGLYVATTGADGIIPFAPTTRRSFSTSEEIRAYVQVRQATTEPLSSVEIGITLTDAGGREVLSDGRALAVERFDSDRAAPFAVTLPLSSLVQGPYLLEVAAKKGATLVSRRVTFAVE